MNDESDEGVGEKYRTEYGVLWNTEKHKEGDCIVLGRGYRR